MFEILKERKTINEAIDVTNMADKQGPYRIHYLHYRLVSSSLKINNGKTENQKHPDLEVIVSELGPDFLSFVTSRGD